MTEFVKDVAILGGCGRVGLPLGIAFAQRGLKTTLYDIDEERVSLIRSGEIPFDEPGTGELLPKVLRDGLLEVSSDPDVLSSAESVIVVIGTPVDEHLNPLPEAAPKAIETVLPGLVDGQLLVLRSTVYPGVTALGGVGGGVRRSL